MIVAGPEAVPLREMLRTLADLARRRSSGPRLPLAPMLGLAAITEDVCKRFNIDPPLYRRRMDFYTNDAAFDASRARRVLGWEPRVALREGLARTLQANRLRPDAMGLHGVAWIAKLVPFAPMTLDSFSQASLLFA